MPPREVLRERLDQRRDAEFLTAVTGNSTSKAAADALAAQRLSTDPPDHGDGPAPA